MRTAVKVQTLRRSIACTCLWCTVLTSLYMFAVVLVPVHGLLLWIDSHRLRQVDTGWCVHVTSWHLKKICCSYSSQLFSMSTRLTAASMWSSCVVDAVDSPLCIDVRIGCTCSNCMAFRQSS